MATVKKTLREIIDELGITEAHLSPRVRENYSLSSIVDYVVTTPRTKTKASSHEREIIHYLDGQNAKYEFERELVVKEDDGIHVCYPDFYFPEQRLFVEYFGVEGQPEYDKEAEKKKQVYEANGVEFEVIHKHEFESGAWRDRFDTILDAEPKEAPVLEPLRLPTPSSFAAAAAAAFAALLFPL